MTTTAAPQLAVNKINRIAIAVYQKYGFHIGDSTAALIAVVAIK